MTEGAILRILASVGMQMASFVHEINALLGNAVAVEAVLDRIRRDTTLPSDARQKLSTLQVAVGELRRSVERQAAYLTDVVSPDARRRRSRQRIAERFDAAARLVLNSAQRLSIGMENRIPDDLRSPPMFPAELTTVFTNLLTNAVKAAGKKGKVRASGRNEAGTVIRVENTGTAVELDESERWFRPFESTTDRVDPVLGQGMGMGLPITRNMLGEYGATILFVKPSSGFASAIEIRFPE
jgi:signal transduction histidine kinase